MKIMLIAAALAGAVSPALAIDQFPIIICGEHRPCDVQRDNTRIDERDPQVRDAEKCERQADGIVRCSSDPWPVPPPAIRRWPETRR